MASAVKKAMIYTLTAAALPLYYVLFPISRLLGGLMLLVFVWQVPLVLGSWYIVFQNAKERRGVCLKPTDLL